MRKIVTIVLSLILILSLSACSGNKAEEETKEDIAVTEEIKEEKEEEKIHEESEMAEDIEEVDQEPVKHNAFIYEWSKIPDEFWDQEGKLSPTYRQELNEVIENTIGDVWGPLALKTKGFKRNFKAGDNYYTLAVEDNDFIFFNEIPQVDALDESLHTLNFYVLYQDYTIYDVEIGLHILEKNKWKIPDIDTDEWVLIPAVDGTIVSKTNRQATMKDDGIYTLSAFHKFNSEYCLEISFPSCQKGKTSYTKEDVEELASKVLPLITVIPLEGDQDTKTLHVNAGTLDLTQDATINLSELNITHWCSGEHVTRGKLRDRVPILLFENDHYTDVSLEQWESRDMLNAYLEEWDQEIEPYTYKGIDIELMHDDTFYSGIIFENNGYLFQLGSNGGINRIENYNSPDEWIDKVVDGIVDFRK